jgi:RNA polymerase sigma-B factor
MPLVETLARRYRGPQAEFDDLLQAGSIGLLNAIDRCDPNRSDEFTAFAVPTVAGEMKRYIRDRGATVRLPRPLHEAAGRLPKVREQLTRRLGRTPTDAELAEAAGVSSSELAELEAALRARGQDDGGAEAVADPRTDSSDERLLLAGAFEALDDQEREIVFLRYIEDLDRKEVAARLGMSESQIGRRTRTALTKLRHELEEDGMRRATNGERTREPAAKHEPAAKPEPAPAKQAPAKASGGHSGRLLLRMPRALHDDLAEAAEREDVSLNRFITGILTAAIRGRPRGEGSERAAGVEPPELEAREVPRWLPAAIVANIVVVVVAAVVAIVLLVIAWQNGW